MLINIMTACGGTVGLLLAFHLFTLKRNAPAVFLGMYVLFLSLLLFEPLISHSYLNKKAVTIPLAISTFGIGPSLYLYCRARLHKQHNTIQSACHFLPAAILALLIALSPVSNEITADSKEDVLVYFLFNFQVFTYLFFSMRVVSGDLKIPHIADRVPVIFVRLLTLCSLVLFSYSFVNTILRTNHGSGFVLTVQVMLNLLILIIALLNAEGLEKRPRSEWVDDQFPTH